MISGSKELHWPFHGYEAEVGVSMALSMPLRSYCRASQWPILERSWQIPTSGYISNFLFFFLRGTTGQCGLRPRVSRHRYLICRHLVGVLERGIYPPQGLYLHDTETKIGEVRIFWTCRILEIPRKTKAYFGGVASTSEWHIFPPTIFILARVILAERRTKPYYHFNFSHL
jgi:hypothetical protein